MQEHLKELVTRSNLKRKEYGTVMSSEANENGLELLNNISWRVAHAYKSQRTAVGIDGSFKSADRQGRLRDSMGETEGCTLLWKFVVDRIPTPVLEECVNTIRQRSMKLEEVLLRALLELYQDMSLRFPNKELNDLDSYRNSEEVRSCSN